MSTRAVIIALVVALALGASAFFLLKPPSKPGARQGVVAAGEPICQFDPALVQSIEITTSPVDVQEIRRAGTDGQWSLVLNRGTAREATWALDPTRVSALLRLLSGRLAIDTPDEKAELGENPTRVSILFNQRAPLSLALSSRTLGGRGIVQVTDSAPGADGKAPPSRLAVIDDAVHNVFRSPGPKGWRDTAAIPGAGPDVARLSLSNQDRMMRLARIGASWALQDPVSAPADVAQVSKLITTLSNIKIASFIDDAPPEASLTGLTSPIARVVMEFDKRSLADAQPGASPSSAISTTTVTRELVIGKPADANAQTRYASLGASGPVFIISGSGLTAELFDPVGYASKVAMQTPVADVGTLVIEKSIAEPAAPPVSAPTTTPGATPTPTPTPATREPEPPASLGRVFKRDLDKWKEITATGELPLDEPNAKAVAELLNFLTKENAESVAFGPPLVWREQGHVFIGSLAGAPLESIFVGASEGSGQLCLRVGGEGEKAHGAVYRWYKREKLPSLVAPLIPVAAALPQPDNQPKEPEVVK